MREAAISIYGDNKSVKMRMFKSDVRMIRTGAGVLKVM